MNTKHSTAYNNHERKYLLWQIIFAQYAINLSNNGLLVKIQKPYGNILKTVPIHKGDCDNYLERYGRTNGLNTNSCMEMSFFDSDEQRAEYMNGTFSMTDDEFYNKYFNEDGTLKTD